MSKFKTAVISPLYIIAAAILLPSLIWSEGLVAQTTVSPQVNLSQEQTDRFLDRMKEQNEREEDRRRAEACNRAQTAFTEAGRKLGTACREASLENISSEGHLQCSLSIQRCQFCGLEDQEDYLRQHARCSEISSVRDDSNESVTSGVLKGVMEQMTGSPSPNFQQTKLLQQKRRLYESCPARAGEDLADRIKRTDQARKDLQKEEDELLKLQEKFDEEKQKGEERLTKMVEDAENLAQTYQEETEKLKQQMEDQDARLGEQVEELEDQMRKAQQAVQALNLARQNANNEFMDKLAEMERSCHSQALAQVAQWNESRRQRMAQGNYGGTMAQMFQGANQGALKQAQDRAQRLYQACVRDRAFTSQRQSLERARESTLRQIQQQEANAVQAQTRIAEQIKRLQTEVRNQQMQRQIQQMERLMTNYQREHQRLERNYAQETLRLQQNLMRMSQQIQLAQTRLAAARREFHELESLTELQKNFAGQSGSKQGSVANAEAELSNVVNTIHTALNQCECSSDSTQGHSFCQRLNDHLAALDPPPTGSRSTYRPSTSNPREVRIEQVQGAAPLPATPQGGRAIGGSQ